jgi:hypothetical protein
VSPTDKLVASTIENSKHTVAVDFDGVLHSYRRGWTGTDPEDPPVPGAEAFVRRLQDRGWVVVVHTARATNPNGVAAVHQWLQLHGFPRLHVTAQKPTAAAYVDDRAVRFDGDWEPIRHLFDDPAHARSWTEVEPDQVFANAMAGQLARWFCDHDTVEESVQFAAAGGACYVDLEEFELFRDDVRAAFLRLLNRPKTRASLRGEE